MSKTLRQFQCRDDLWARVETLAKRRGIAPDDVVQAALLQLFKGAAAKKKEEGAGAEASGGNTPARPVMPQPSRAASAPLPSAGSGVPRPPGVRPPGSGPLTSPPPNPSAGASQSRAPTSLPQPRLPKPATAPTTPLQPSTIPPGTPGLGASAPGKVAPTLPRPPTHSRLPPPTGAPQSKPRPLYVLFEGQWYEIDKEEFVIGRGQKFSDLAIKDANISRRHCSVVRRGNDYFIKDLGSTNGIEFEGQRVDNHKVNDGSVYFLCDHELRFTFTPPGQAG